MHGVWVPLLGPESGCRVDLSWLSCCRKQQWDRSRMHCSDYCSSHNRGACPDLRIERRVLSEPSKTQEESSDQPAANSSPDKKG